MFTNPFPNAFGLDIGDLSVKLVQLRNISFCHRQACYTLKAYGSIELPAGLIINGELQQPEEIRRRIKFLLAGKKKKKAIRSSWVVACLPDSQSFIKLIHVEKPAEDILDSDISALAKKHLPFEENDHYYLQWQIIPNEDNNQESARILIAAIPKIISDSYTYLLESIGLGVIALEVEAIAITRAMINARQNYENEAVAILEMGATRSSIIIYDQNVIQFSKSLPFSGEIITTALAQKLHLTHDEAERIKREEGLDYNNTRGNSWEVVANLVDNLVLDIKNAINFYNSHFPKPNQIKNIIIGGGCSNYTNLPAVISNKLNIPIKAGDPWQNLSTHKKIPIAPEYSLNYVTAIGLALRAADNPFFIKDVV